MNFIKKLTSPATSSREESPDKVPPKNAAPAFTTAMSPEESPTQHGTQPVDGVPTKVVASAVVQLGVYAELSDANNDSEEAEFNDEEGDDVVAVVGAPGGGDAGASCTSSPTPPPKSNAKKPKRTRNKKEKDIIDNQEDGSPVRKSRRVADASKAKGKKEKDKRAALYEKYSTLQKEDEKIAQEEEAECESSEDEEDDEDFSPADGDAGGYKPTTKESRNAARDAAVNVAKKVVEEREKHPEQWNKRHGLCELYGKCVLDNWKAFQEHYNDDTIVEFAQNFIPSAIPGEPGTETWATNLSHSAFVGWLTMTKQEFGHSLDEIQQMLRQNYDVERDLLQLQLADGPPPNQHHRSSTARCISGMGALRPLKLDPQCYSEEQGKDVADKGLNCLVQAATEQHDDDTEFLEEEWWDKVAIAGIQDAQLRGKCSMAGAKVTGPPTYKKWLLVEDKRQASHVKKKYGLVPEGVFAHRQHAKDGRLVEVMDHHPVSIYNCPQRLVIGTMPDVMLLRASACFTSVVTGLTTKNPALRCRKHKKKKACGSDLKPNEVVFVDGRDCNLVDDHVYYIGVYRMDRGKVRSCRVGVLKCLVGQTQYFCNRAAMVTSVDLGKKRGGGADAKKGKQWVIDVGGVAEIAFLDCGHFHERATNAPF